MVGQVTMSDTYSGEDIRKQGIPVRNVLRYWRSSLADEDLRSVDSRTFFSTPAASVSSGFIDKALTARLVDQFIAHKQPDKDISDVTPGLKKGGDVLMPVIAVLYGLAPEHHHGKATGGRFSGDARYPLHVPALLSSSGALSPA
ncbi:MAG: hypothetical protein WCF85_19825, partial [Rhodospirillaceae bacterium]